MSVLLLANGSGSSAAVGLLAFLAVRFVPGRYHFSHTETQARSVLPIVRSSKEVSGPDVEKSFWTSSAFTVVVRQLKHDGITSLEDRKIPGASTETILTSFASFLFISPLLGFSHYLR